MIVKSNLGPVGLQPTTLCLRNECSMHLSYGPDVNYSKYRVKKQKAGGVSHNRTRPLPDPSGPHPR